jgi:hypothetical protein
MKTNRHRYNRLILKELEKEIERHPTGRFWQIIYNLSIVNGYQRSDGSMDILDEYNRESEATYNKIIETLKKRE